MVGYLQKFEKAQMESAHHARQQQRQPPTQSVLASGQQLAQAQIETAHHARQQESQPPKQSVLASELLMQYYSGHCSAACVQRIAMAAMLDGCSHEEVAHLASFGAYGLQSGNAPRDLNRHYIKGCLIPEPHILRCPIWSPSAAKVEEEEVAMFLPHKLLASLAKYGEFDRLMGVNKLEAFWDAVLPNDPRLHFLWHEQGLNKEALRKHIPLFLHGDGVEFVDEGSIMVWHTGSILSIGDAMDASLLLAAFPKKCTLVPSKKDKRSTWIPICEALTKSFELAFKGEDEEGKSLHSLGYKFVVWSLTGDHEHFSNNLNLPHWQRNSWCWQCDASQGKHADPTKDGKEFRPVHNNCVNRTMEAEQLQRLSPHPFFTIPGVSTFTVEHDALHVLFCHGVAAHALGSIIHGWLWPDDKGRNKIVEVRARLQELWAEIQLEYTENKSPMRLSGLRLTMICDPEKPFQDYPTLKGKGSEIKHLMPVILNIAKRRSTGSHYDLRAIAAFEALTMFSRLIDASDMVPTPEIAETARNLMQQFLLHNQWLNRYCVNEGVKKWHVVYKHHMANHLADNFQFLSPRFSWCFKAEDFVGQMSRLAHSCTFGVKTSRLSLKFMDKCRLMLHVRFTRGLITD
jgi:hypothetical protein